MRKNSANKKHFKAVSNNEIIKQSHIKIMDIYMVILMIFPEIT
jgi:hypothetical protein